MEVLEKGLVLTTVRLVLVPVAESHLDDIHRLHSDSLVTKALFGGQPLSRKGNQKKVAQYVRDWQENGFGFFAVHLRVAGAGLGEFVGRSGLRFLEDTGEVEHGNCFFREASGKGISPEAGGEVIRFGFERLGLKRIVAVIRPENERSLRSISKEGFRYIDDRRHYGRMMKYFEVKAEDYGFHSR